MVVLFFSRAVGGENLFFAENLFFSGRRHVIVASKLSTDDADNGNGKDEYCSRRTQNEMKLLNTVIFSFFTQIRYNMSLYYNFPNVSVTGLTSKMSLPGQKFRSFIKDSIDRTSEGKTGTTPVFLNHFACTPSVAW